MDRFARRCVAAAVCAALVGTAAPAVAGAAPAPAPDPDPAPTFGAASAVVAAGAVSTGMLAAMQRDLGLSTDAALARLAREDAAARTQERLRASLGGSFAGAWVTPDDQDLVVAVTDAAAAERVGAAGATPRVVARSLRQLDRAKASLDRVGAPTDVAGWYVDVTTNSVVVLAQAAALDTAAEFVAASGADPDAVRIEASTERPRLLYDVRGGDPYFPGNFRCSIGFAVVGGFVTAGHCGPAGTTTRGNNQAVQGVVQGSVFPGQDHGWVAVNSNWTPTPVVNRYNIDQTIIVMGAQEAPVNAAVCRSGSTTFWRCGTIIARNVTANYAEGQVTGLTRTTACAEPGDSGGSWLAGQQAQGVTSGGSGNCTTGGTTLFQPLLPILAHYGLTLVTGERYAVARSATTQSGHRSPHTAFMNGLNANHTKILAVGVDCAGWFTTHTIVWTAPDSSWYIYNVTTTAMCTN